MVSYSGEGKRQLSSDLAEEEIRKLEGILRRRGARFIPSRNRYERFRARLNGSLVMAFTTGRIVYHEDLADVILEALRKEEVVELGSDEVGKGEDLGPIVVAAVVLDGRSLAFLRSRGLLDTKSSSTLRINYVYDLIVSRALSIGIREISVKEFLTVWRRRNLNRLLASWHREAILRALNGVKRVDRIVVDCFDRRVLSETLSEIADEVDAELVLEERADLKYASVAAASIVARIRRENLMARGDVGSKWRRGLRRGP